MQRVRRRLLAMPGQVVRRQFKLPSCAAGFGLAQSTRGSRSDVRKSGTGLTKIQTGQIADFGSHLATLNGMALIGRTREIKELDRLLSSKEAEFLALYGGIQLL